MTPEALSSLGLTRLRNSANLLHYVQGVVVSPGLHHLTTFYYYEGLTLREIGRVLDLTEGRILQILHSALVRLRQNLAEESRLSERT
jgi:hypothetical protein